MERVVTRAIDVNEHLIAERSTGREEKTVRLSYKDTFLKLADLKVCPERFAKRIALSAGLRNILVHDYNDVDRRILHRSVKDCLKDYRKYLDYVLRFLRRIGPPPP